MNYLCNECGYVGKSISATKGSFLVEVFLWLLFIIPGLIYSMWRLTTRHRACRVCKSPHIIPENSPNYIQRMAE